MKKVLALILALCMIVALAACGSSKPAETAPAAEPAAEDTPFVVTACIASEPETIDPTMISSVDGNTYVNHLFENLLTFGIDALTVLGELLTHRIVKVDDDSFKVFLGFNQVVMLSL